MRGLILDRRKYIVSVEERRIKRRITFSTLAFILFVVCFAWFAFSVKKAPTGGATANNNNGDDNNTIVKSDSGTESNGSQDNDIVIAGEENKKPELIKKNIPETYRVTKVVDGDTIYVSGIKTRIRLIGVNTPETVSSSKPVECYGPEASKYLTSLLLGKNVGLETDPASGDVDIYGRPLRFVYLNGENVNQKLILEGYGKEYTFNNVMYQYHSEFVEAEDYASLNKVGLWSPNTCNGRE